ncbi:MAG: MotA/TolQ/ExbB proton channel family protein [Verrucomicrobiota bacterium]
MFHSRTLRAASWALCLFASSALIFSASSQDLDLDDLGIPGLEESAPAPASSSSSDGVEADVGGSGDSGASASSGEMNLLDMIKAGGWSMWVLGTFSIAVIGLLVYCLIDLQKKNFQPDGLVNALAAEMEAANLEGAMGQVRDGSTCLSSTVGAGLNHIADYGYESLGTDKLEEVMGAAAKKTNRGRVRLINYFSVISQAAPMMGLLGTVSGMIGAFAKLSSGGTGDPSKFAGSISEALITTASGLVIALPAIFCYFFFRDRLQSLVAECDEAAGELMATLRRSVIAYQNGEQA